MKAIETDELNWKAFNRGIVSCYEARGDIHFVKNPYKEESKEWQSWNYGWNTKGGN